MRTPLTSIVILTRNIKRLGKIFEVLERQKDAPSFEMVVINSGKERDDKYYISNNFYKKYNFGLRIYQIKPSEFGHGRTRNWAVGKTRGEIVVFLTDDALPESNTWLTRLVAPLEKKGVAAVFGRQVPYNSSSIYEQFNYVQAYPDKDRIIKKDDIKHFSVGNLLYSNVNGAIKRELLRRFSFDEKVVMSEDHWWAKEILEAGYKIMYLRQAAVYHSHNYSLSQLFCRNFTSGYSLIGFGGEGLINSIWQGISYIEKEIKFVSRETGYLSFLSYLRLFVYEFVRVSGFILGKNGRFLPAGIKRKLMVSVAGVFPRKVAWPPRGFTPPAPPA